MGDSTVKKLESRHSPHGEAGQKYLVSGINLSMRLWEDEEAGATKTETEREYETVGFVIRGKAELMLEDQKLILQAGDSWLVPKHSRHSYKILERFTAVEATSPPAQMHGRDAGGAR